MILKELQQTAYIDLHYIVKFTLLYERSFTANKRIQ